MEKTKEIIKYILLVFLTIVLVSFILLACTALFIATYYIVFWIVELLASDNIAKIIAGFIAAILFIIIFIWDEEKAERSVINIRDSEKLDSFYTQICEIHKKSFPDMRPGQFLLNSLGYINSTLHRDPFFPESDELIELFKQYANSNSMWYQGWDILNRKENDSGGN